MSRKRQTQGLTGIGLIIVIIFALYNFLSGSGGTSSTVTPTAQLPSVPTVSGGGSTGSDPTSAWLKIYFTNPNPPDQVGSGIDQFVVPEINNAQKTIDVTSFDLARLWLLLNLQLVRTSMQLL